VHVDAVVLMMVMATVVTIFAGQGQRTDEQGGNRDSDGSALKVHGISPWVSTSFAQLDGTFATRLSTHPLSSRFGLCSSVESLDDECGVR
jgi:hypothetical protein